MEKFPSNYSSQTGCQVSLRSHRTWNHLNRTKSIRVPCERSENIKRSHVSKVSTSQIFQPAKIVPCRVNNRAIFVWPWNENARTKQKQQTNGNRAIWLVYRTDTNARGFWLVKRTLGWKNFMPENFLEINRYFALTSYCNTIGQSNNAFSI